MSQNTDYVAASSPVAETGGVFYGPPGTPLPTDATSALDAALVPLGYCSDDGVQYSGDAASSDDVNAWGGDVVATLNTSGSVDRRKVKLLETLNPDVLTFLFGEGNVTVTPATANTPTMIAVADKGIEPPKGVFVFDMFTSQGTRSRYVYGNGQPQVTDEDPLVHSAVGGYEIEVTAFKDASGVRKYVYHALNDQAAAA